MHRVSLIGRAVDQLAYPGTLPVISNPSECVEHRRDAQRRGGGLAYYCVA